MSVNIVGSFYRGRFVLDETTVRAIVDTLRHHGWTYNVELADGYRRNGDTWTFEEETDDQQNDQKLQIAIHNVVEAGGGALSLSRKLPDGQTSGTTIGIRPPSEDVDFWQLSISDRARLFTGRENQANQRLLIGLFADLADSISPYVGSLGPEQAVYYGFDGDFTAPPRYFTGVTYLSYDVPGIPLEDLKVAGVAHRVVKLSDGVLFEACENDPPWSCLERDLEELETFLGMDYYPN